MATKIETGLKNIVVAVKQVPDTNQVKIDPETGTLIREGVPFIVNPFDTHALEAGLQLKDRFGGQVIAISMGPPNTVMTLVSDRMFGGADTLATSYVLTEAIRRIERENGRIDLVICGKQTIDGDTAQVGPGLATRLGFAQLTLVDQIIDFSQEGHTITVRRKLEGRKEVVQTQLPALLTMVREGNKPRYPTVPARLGAEEAEVQVWNNDLLKLAPELIGLRGSATNVKRIFAPERKMGEILGDGEKDPQGAVQLLVQKLVERDLLSF